MPNITDEYKKLENNYNPSISRTAKNAKLYNEVYGKYENKDKLPIEDNVLEIDMERLKELVSSTNDTHEHQIIRENLNILDTRKRKIDEQKIYDINKILEKAKNDNSKLKETTVRKSIVNKNILSTLESREISLAEIKEASIKYDREQEIKELQMKELEKNKDLTLTRELKFKELSEEVEQFNSNPLTTNVMPDNDLSLDLFEELKPTGNTIVTKPIKEEMESNNKTNFHSDDTSDIDIIKPAVGGNSNVDEFFTNSYEFSKKDFAELTEEDLIDTKKENNVLKIILLIIAIIVFAGAIVYFVKTFGLGL